MPAHTQGGLTARTLGTEVLTELIKTVASAGTPEVLSATSRPFRKATIIAKKAARTSNVGIVYLGLSATNDSQPWAIAPDAVIQINALQDTAFDLANFYLDVATSADGVIIWYA